MKSGSEARWTIPDSWVWTSIGELGDVVGGGTPSTKEAAYWNDEIPWICPADLTGYSAKTIKRGAKGISTLGLANSSAKMMPAGAVHFSSRAPVGYVVISAVSLTTNQGFKSLVPIPGIFNEYVYHYLRASRGLARERASGTTFLELSMRSFGALPIPLAPEREQCRIVAKVEQLLSELDNGIENLKTVLAQLAAYRQSVLKHAFEGKLTAQWREENGDKLETSEQLLARIREARSTRYGRQMEEWKAAVEMWERGGGSDRKPRRPRAPAAVSTAAKGEMSQPGVPDGWVRVTAESVGRVQLGRQRSPKNRSRDYPTKYIRAANITETGLDFESVLDMDFAPHEFAAYRLRKGDLLLAEASGSASQVGKPAIWNDELPRCCFQNTVIRHEPHCRDYAVFLLWLYRFLYVSGQFSRIAGGVGINHLGAARFAQIALPLCSLPEQREIVRRLEERFAAIERSERQIDLALRQTEALRGLILKKAFSGQLIPQDPNDEPASVLLDRIRAERKRSAKGRRRARAVA